jgi:hypothetical protein
VKTEKQFTRQTEAVTAIRRRVIDILSRLDLMPTSQSLMRLAEMTGEFKQLPWRFR